MKWLFGQYEEEAKAAAEDGGDIKVPDYYVGWEAIEPLVKAKWDQGSPYNDRCHRRVQPTYTDRMCPPRQWLRSSIHTAMPKAPDKYPTASISTNPHI